MIYVEKLWNCVAYSFVAKTAKFYGLVKLSWNHFDAEHAESDLPREISDLSLFIRRPMKSAWGPSFLADKTM